LVCSLVYFDPIVSLLVLASITSPKIALLQNQSLDAIGQFHSFL